MRILCFVAILFLTACAKDESIRAYGAGDDAFALVSINGQKTNAPATVSFPRPFRIAGTGPCNSFSGPQSAPYPWIRVGTLAVTRRACPDLAVEAAYLAALTRMRVAIVKESGLTLSNDAGEEMVFTRLPAD